MKLAIIIPAHNEANRIEKTIYTYYEFFAEKQKHTPLNTEFIIVTNGCTDNTINVVKHIRENLKSDTIFIIDEPRAGKGLAIKEGFINALTRHNDIIGFVDADMATLPDAFYNLVCNLTSYDGVIASRYMPGSIITPARPAYKRWGSRIIYEPLVKLLFGLSYHDLQCGAKIFKRTVIEKIVSQLTITQWAFDVELLYLCAQNKFIIKEIPTVWSDQAESKLTLKAGIRMLGALTKLWFYSKKNKK